MSGSSSHISFQYSKTRRTTRCTVGTFLENSNALFLGRSSPRSISKCCPRVQCDGRTKHNGLERSWLARGYLNRWKRLAMGYGNLPNLAWHKLAKRNTATRVVQP